MNKDLIIALNAIEQKHDVELAITDDLEKLVSLNKNAISEASRYVENVKSTWQKLYGVKDEIDDMKSYIKSIPGAKNALGYNNQEMNKLISQIDTQAKSLGLDVKTIKGYSVAKEAILKNNEYMKQLDQQLKAGESILSSLK